jgi:hypothetical protein
LSLWAARVLVLTSNRPILHFLLSFVPVVPFVTKLIKAFLYLLSPTASTHLVSQFAVAINAINNIRQSNPLLIMKAWRYDSTDSGYTCGQLVPSVSIN